MTCPLYLEKVYKLLEEIRDFTPDPTRPERNQSLIAKEAIKELKNEEAWAFIWTEPDQYVKGEQ